MEARLRGEWLDSCALDVADDLKPPDDAWLAASMGITVKRVTQISAEASARLRRGLREELEGDE
jgi:hypothetical protein